MKLHDKKFTASGYNQRLKQGTEPMSLTASDVSKLRGLGDRDYREAREVLPDLDGTYEAVSFVHPDSQRRVYGWLTAVLPNGDVRVELGDDTFAVVPPEEIRRFGGPKEHKAQLQEKLKKAIKNLGLAGLRADLREVGTPMNGFQDETLKLISLSYNSQAGEPTRQELSDFIETFYPTAEVLEVEHSMPGRIGVAIREAEMPEAAVGGEVLETLDPNNEADFDKEAVVTEEGELALESDTIEEDEYFLEAIPDESLDDLGALEKDAQQRHVGPKGLDEDFDTSNNQFANDFDQIAPPGQPAAQLDTQDHQWPDVTQDLDSDDAEEVDDADVLDSAEDVEDADVLESAPAGGGTGGGDGGGPGAPAGLADDLEAPAVGKPDVSDLSTPKPGVPDNQYRTMAQDLMSMGDKGTIEKALISYITQGGARALSTQSKAFNTQTLLEAALPTVQRSDPRLWKDIVTRTTNHAAKTPGVAPSSAEPAVGRENMTYTGSNSKVVASKRAAMFEGHSVSNNTFVNLHPPTAQSYRAFSMNRFAKRGGYIFARVAWEKDVIDHLDERNVKTLIENFVKREVGESKGGADFGFIGKVYIRDVNLSKRTAEVRFAATSDGFAPLATIELDD